MTTTVSELARLPTDQSLPIVLLSRMLPTHHSSLQLALVALAIMALVSMDNPKVSAALMTALSQPSMMRKRAGCSASSSLAAPANLAG